MIRYFTISSSLRNRARRLAVRVKCRLGEDRENSVIGKLKNQLGGLLTRRSVSEPEQRPRMLTVEPTNRYNLNCPFCLLGLQNRLGSAEHDLLPRDFGCMDFGLYEKIVRDAVEFGIPFIAKTFAESVPELVPYNPKYRRNLQPKPCTDIYRCICIFWNGDVVPCCYDLEGKEIMGNVGKETLGQIWTSPKYAGFRRHVDNARYDPEGEPELCRNCLKWGHVDQLRPGQSTTTVKLNSEDV